MTMAAETLEASRKLAESLSSTLGDEERAGMAAAAAYVVEGMRLFCTEADSKEEVAVRMAHVIARMLAEVQRTSLMEASDFCGQNMLAYGLAAGALAGVYELPGVDAPPESERMSEPLRLVPRDEQIGQYL